VGLELELQELEPELPPLVPRVLAEQLASTSN